MSDGFDVNAGFTDREIAAMQAAARPSDPGLRDEIARVLHQKSCSWNQASPTPISRCGCTWVADALLPLIEAARRDALTEAADALHIDGPGLSDRERDDMRDWLRDRAGTP